MARTQKYSGDLLLEATLQYSEICAGKIKYVELAEWASANIPGLEGVKDYHFSRPMVVVDKAGGKKTVVKECTQRVMELNKARSVAVNMESNPLIKSSRIDDFLDMPRQKQVHIILQTRNQFESAMKSSRYAEMEHNRVQQENRLLRESQIEMERNLKALSDKQIEFGDALRKLKKYINDELRKKALESIGWRLSCLNDATIRG